MAVMSNQKLASQIKSIKGNSAKLAEQIHEVLISCAYQAYAHGQTTPFNNLLEAVRNTTRLKGITMWAEVHGCVRIQNDKFVLNKKVRQEAGVENEADFEAFEVEMRKAPKWFEMLPKQKADSIFDLDQYATSVETKLSKEGYIGLAEAVKNLINEYHAAQKAEISEFMQELVA